MKRISSFLLPWALVPATALFATNAAANTPPGLPDCHLADFDPDARKVTSDPVAPSFSTLNLDGRTDAFDSKLTVRKDGPPIRDPAQAAEIHARVVEALARYGVRPEHIKLVHIKDKRTDEQKRLDPEPQDEFHIFTSLVDVADPRIRRHIVFHAQRFNLRPFFSKIEPLNATARRSFFDLPPEIGAELVNSLDLRDFTVMNHWFNTAPAAERSIRKLVGCK